MYDDNMPDFIDEQDRQSWEEAQDEAHIARNFDEVGRQFGTGLMD